MKKLKNQIIKKINFLKRTVDDKIFRKKLYRYLLAYTVLVYGLFVNVTLFNVLKNKFLTIKDLEVLNTSLLARKSYVEQGVKLLFEINTYLSVLDSRISNDPDIEEILVALANASSRNGFKQNNLRVLSITNNMINFDANFSGSLANVSNLLLSIENLDRFIQVNNFSYRIEESSGDLKLNMSVYFLHK